MNRRVASAAAAGGSTAGAVTAAVIGGLVSERRLETGSAALYADAVRMADAFVSAAEHTGDWTLIREAKDAVALAMERAWEKGGLTQQEIGDLRGLTQSTVSSAIRLLRIRRERSAAKARVETIGG